MKLKGIRILLTIPKKEESVIEVSEELKKQQQEEYFKKLSSLEVFAVGDAVEGIKKGDKVYIPSADLQRADFVMIEGENKAMISATTVAIVW